MMGGPMVLRITLVAWMVLLASGCASRAKDAPPWYIETVAGNYSDYSGSIAPDAYGAFGAKLIGDGGPADAARLYFPVSVVVDAAGNLYIADGFNRVRRVSPNGTINTVAGTGHREFSGDGGPATAARLSWPTGLAMDAVGNLYLATNHRVRRVYPQREDE